MDIEKTKNIALLPGSFKPPHAAHLAAVEFLLAQPIIDKLIIVISNRSRRIPGTQLGLDAEASKSLFEKIIGYSNIARDRVHIEIASHRAIDHALGYFNRVTPTCKLYFCLGEADAKAGDSRFEKINTLSRQYGVKAEIIALPEAENPVRATSLRQALGSNERAKFYSGLPDWLDTAQMDELWKLAKLVSRPISEIRNEKVSSFVGNVITEPVLERSISLDESSNPQFHFVNHSHEEIVIKYGGDELGSETPHQKREGDRPERIGIERRAIKRLQSELETPFRVPRLIKHDKRQRLLALHLGNGETLEKQLRRGEINLDTASKIGRFLHRLHTIPKQESPFWESFEQESSYFQCIIDNRYSLVRKQLSSTVGELVKELLIRDDNQPHTLISHMSFYPKNILIQADAGIMLTELGKCITRGDGAIDIAEIVYQYIVVGFRQKKLPLVKLALARLLESYAYPFDERSRSSASRVIAYLILHLAANPEFPRALVDTLESIAKNKNSDCDMRMLTKIPVLLDC